MQNKHIVYLIKVKRDSVPNKYIGSKSNAEVIDGKIYGSRGLYTGSSKDKVFKSLLEYCDYEIQVLASFDDYQECLRREKELHLKYDVVASPEFFNKAIATINTYSDPSYATYRHDCGKIARLPRNHPKVLSGEWYGVTKGVRLSEDHPFRNNSGKNNPFYGRKHTDETKRISGKKIGDAHRGKPKNAEQRRKMSEARKKYWDARKKSYVSRKEESI